jgi:hypothetical protein
MIDKYQTKQNDPLQYCDQNSKEAWADYKDDEDDEISMGVPVTDDEYDDINDMLGYPSMKPNNRHSTGHPYESTQDAQRRNATSKTDDQDNARRDDAEASNFWKNPIDQSKCGAAATVTKPMQTEFEKLRAENLADQQKVAEQIREQHLASCQLKKEMDIINKSVNDMYADMALQFRQGNERMAKIETDMSSMAKAVESIHLMLKGMDKKMKSSNDGKSEATSGSDDNKADKRIRTRSVDHVTD